jgi:hypothetical protein
MLVDDEQVFEASWAVPLPPVVVSPPPRRARTPVKPSERLSGVLEGRASLERQRRRQEEHDRYEEEIREFARLEHARHQPLRGLRHYEDDARAAPPPRAAASLAPSSSAPALHAKPTAARRRLRRAKDVAVVTLREGRAPAEEAPPPEHWTKSLGRLLSEPPPPPPRSAAVENFVGASEGRSVGTARRADLLLSLESEEVPATIAALREAARGGHDGAAAFFRVRQQELDAAASDIAITPCA